MTIKIFLVDDQYLMQEGIKAILKDEPEIEIVGTAKDGREAIALVTKTEPDIVLLDLEIPRLNGIAVTKYICEFLPHTKVIILSSHRGQNYISQALEAGASSYMLKDSLVEDLKQAIYSLSRGYSYIQAKLLNQAVNHIQANNIVNSQKTTVNSQKTTVYTQKYRKHIYSPAAKPTASSPHSAPSTYSGGKKLPQYSSGINRDSLAPIFESTSDIKNTTQLTTSLSSKSTAYIGNLNRQSRLQKLIWIILAIASCWLAIWVF